MMTEREPLEYLMGSLGKRFFSFSLLSWNIQNKIQLTAVIKTDFKEHTMHRIWLFKLFLVKAKQLCVESRIHSGKKKIIHKRLSVSPWSAILREGAGEGGRMWGKSPRQNSADFKIWLTQL